MGCINNSQSVALNCKLNVETWTFFLSWQGEPIKYAVQCSLSTAISALLHDWHCGVWVLWGDDGTRDTEMTLFTSEMLPRQRSLTLTLACHAPWLRLRGNLTLRHISHSGRMLSGPELSIKLSHWSHVEIEHSYWIKLMGTTHSWHKGVKLSEPEPRVMECRWGMWGGWAWYMSPRRGEERQG